MYVKDLTPLQLACVGSKSIRLMEVILSCPKVDISIKRNGKTIFNECCSSNSNPSRIVQLFLRHPNFESVIWNDDNVSCMLPIIITELK